jgi:hypothetical protein
LEKKKVTCPSEFPILLFSEYCVSQCPFGYVQSSEDVFECVSQVQCPTNFTIKQGSNVECTKPAPSQITYGEKCEDGYEEWVSNFCFLNCPEPFLDNGISCLKPTITRDYTPPSSQCDSIFLTYSSTGCKVSAIGISIFTVLSIGIIWLVWMFFELFKTRNPKDPLDSAIKNIETYFKTKQFT